MTLPDSVKIRTGAQGKPNVSLADLTEDGVRELVPGRGLVDIKIYAVDVD